MSSSTRLSKIISRQKMSMWLTKPKMRNEKTCMNLIRLPIFTRLNIRSKNATNVCHLITRKNKTMKIYNEKTSEESNKVVVKDVMPKKQRKLEMTTKVAKIQTNQKNHKVTSSSFLMFSVNRRSSRDKGCDDHGCNENL